MIDKLFQGYYQNFISCINVDYKSTHRELFADLQVGGAGGELLSACPPPCPWQHVWPRCCYQQQAAHKRESFETFSTWCTLYPPLPPPPLQLDVKGCKSIYDSFDKYCEVETLEGDNQYNAEGHGLQVGARPRGLGRVWPWVWWAVSVGRLRVGCGWAVAMGVAGLGCEGHSMQVGGCGPRAAARGVQTPQQWWRQCIPSAAGASAAGRRRHPAVTGAGVPSRCWRGCC